MGKHVERSSAKVQAKIVAYKNDSGRKNAMGQLRGHRFGGHRFHRQTSIENCVVDFYCAEKRLILEIHWSVHLLYGKPESDRKRQEHLEGLGFRVLRFTNEEVKNSIEMVLSKILAELN